MILITDAKNDKINSILHVCGDDPDKVEKAMQELEYSPRMWR